MPELSRLDKKVVKYWWGEALISIFGSGYILDKHIPSLRVSHLPETCRSFQEIVDSGAIISATAKRKVDRIPVKLTIVRGARDEGNVQEQNVTYFDAEGHTIMVTPITGPSWPLSVRLPRLPWSPLHRIEESDAPESESSSTDSSLEPYRSENVTFLPTDPSLQPYRSENVSFVPADLSLQPYRSANVSFISTDPSLQSYYSANTSFISTDSSLQSYYTANASFITDSSLQSYHTAYASVSSHSTIYSVSTSSHRSDASLPYSVNSVNSYKSRKTVLYPRREHPPPVAISSQELSESPLFE